MVCSNCGTENRAGRKFCSECAAPLALPCPSCGALNEPGEKFCGECAQPLPAAGTITPPNSVDARIPIAERRLVSILFADLVGFTHARRRHGTPRTPASCCPRYFDLSRDVIGRYGGTVEKFIGDAVMAVWGAPTAHEDDAERAVRAALELVDAVRTLGPDDPGPRRRPDRRGGGHARRDEPGHGRRRPRQHRQSPAIGRGTRHGPRRRSDASRGRQRHRLRGGRRADAQGQGGARAGVARAPCRRRASAAATDPRRWRRRSSAATTSCVCSRTCSMRPGANAEPGSSRSSARRASARAASAWEFSKYIDGAGRHGLAGTTAARPAYGEGISFWALGEMVRRRAGLLETDDEPTTRPKIAETVAEYVPDETERRWIEPALLALLGVEASAGGSEQLFAAWRTFFERIADRGPVAMVFEDFHFADSRPARLRRPPARVEPRTSRSTSSRSPVPSCSSGGPTGAPASATSSRCTSSHSTRPRCASCSPASSRACPRAAVHGDRRARGRHPAVRGRDGPDARRRGAARRSRTATYRPVGDLTSLAVPETLTALIARRLDGLAGRTSGARVRRRRPRPELHAGGARGRLRDRRGRARAPTARRSSAASC